MLKTINRYWGLKVIVFFHCCNKSKKTFKQLSHFSSNCFSYLKKKHFINTYVVKKFLIGVPYYFFRYNIIIYDWAALDKNNHVLNIFFPYFIIAYLHYSIFGEIIEDLHFFGLMFCFVCHYSLWMI